MIDRDCLQQAIANARAALLNARNSDGVWSGRLSSSPLATAVAVFALYKVDAQKHRPFIKNGLRWLAENQHPDGGWGDAEKLDPANLSTTLLCYSAFFAVDRHHYPDVIEQAESFIRRETGGLTAEHISRRLYQIYGKDRTFAVPILTMCALAGIFGADGWNVVKPLPFELAVLPRNLFRCLRLTVVSYALPALIAIGQVRFHYKRPGNPLTRMLRKMTQKQTLKLLAKLQPDNGGFLEATPLTSFVTMSLAAMGLTSHPVVKKGVEFITQSVRADGSWPIDTNLSTWGTSLSVQALSEDDLSADDKKIMADWYLAQQHNDRHVYTAAKPGGWGWTNLPGAVPDADDTAGALLALHRLGIRTDAVKVAAKQGVCWLLDLQNNDGGVPTFCKGWGRLEFDRSCPDITAHAAAAWFVWKESFDSQIKHQIEQAIERALKYLEAVQSNDGAFVPLWFGNPFSDDKANPVYGMAKVLQALATIEMSSSVSGVIEKASSYLLKAQSHDGGWGADIGQNSTVEETSLAVDALAAVGDDSMSAAIEQGVNYLIERTQQGSDFKASPIGLYFAKLWYAEQLYPVIFSLKALQSASAFFNLTDTAAKD